MTPTPPPARRGAQKGNQNARKAAARVHLSARIAPEAARELARLVETAGSVGAALDSLLILRAASTGSTAPQYLRELAVWLHATQSGNPRMRETARALHDAAEEIQRGGAHK